MHMMLQHKDRVDLKLMDDWWHSLERSSEDNHNKQKIIVYGDYDEATQKQEYDIHFRRFV